MIVDVRCYIHVIWSCWLHFDCFWTYQSWWLVWLFFLIRPISYFHLEIFPFVGWHCCKTQLQYCFLFASNKYRIFLPLKVDLGKLKILVQRLFDCLPARTEISDCKLLLRWIIDSFTACICSRPIARCIAVPPRWSDILCLCLCPTNCKMYCGASRWSGIHCMHCDAVKFIPKHF